MSCSLRAAGAIPSQAVCPESVSPAQQGTSAESPDLPNKHGMTHSTSGFWGLGGKDHLLTKRMRQVDTRSGLIWNSLEAPLPFHLPLMISHLSFWAPTS